MSPDSKPRNLKSILAELHEALEALPEDDASAQADLREAARAIDEHLDPGLETDSTEASLSERLQRAIEGFEGRHPKLTELVGRIADALADIGV